MRTYPGLSCEYEINTMTAKKPKKKPKAKAKKKQKKHPNITATITARRAEIKNRIEDLGLWNLHKTDLAKEFKVSRDAIYRDIKSIVTGTPEKELNEIRFELSGAFKKAIKEARHILNSTPEEEIVLKAAKTVADLCDKYTKMLEAYGIKAIQPQEINLQGEIKNVVTLADFQVIYEESKKKLKEAKKDD